MRIDLFKKIIGLFICINFTAFSQPADSPITITFSEITFPVDRQFTISVLILNTESRPVLVFPDIPGLTKRNTTTSTTTAETDAATTTNQIITQTYIAARPGSYRLSPFVISANGITARSDGATLTVQPVADIPAITDPATAGDGFASQLPREVGTAFLSLRASKATVYRGEEFSLRLSLFVAENYPFPLEFSQLEQQIQAIQKQIRPVNAWEENFNIAELRPFPVVINNRKFVEYRVYEAAFFPLSARIIQIPAVSLTLLRLRPATPALPGSSTAPDRQTTPGSLTATRPNPVAAGQAKPGPPKRNLAKPAPVSPPVPTEAVTFLTRPLTITVRPLPPHPLQAQVAVGTFRLTETVERTSIPVGQSTRYTFRVEGEGNIAALQPPTLPTALPGLEILPGGTTETIERTASKVLGFKAFQFYVVPRQVGIISLRNAFQWVFFDPKTARYDTLQPSRILRAGGGRVAKPGESGPAGAPGDTIRAGPMADGSIYAGINESDSTRQPVNINALVRAIANVALVIMLAGMIFVFFKK